MNSLEFQYLNFFNPALMCGFPNYQEMEKYYTRLKWFSLWLFFGLFCNLNHYAIHHQAINTYHYYFFIVFFVLPLSAGTAYLANIYCDKILNRILPNHFALSHVLKTWQKRKVEITDLIKQLETLSDSEKEILLNNPDDTQAAIILRHNWHRLFILELNQRTK